MNSLEAKEPKKISIEEVLKILGFEPTLEELVKNKPLSGFKLDLQNKTSLFVANKLFELKERNQTTITKRYREILLAIHPDVNSHKFDESSIEYLNELTKFVNQAYKIVQANLGDKKSSFEKEPKSRKPHNRQRPKSKKNNNGSKEPNEDSKTFTNFVYDEREWDDSLENYPKLVEKHKWWQYFRSKNLLPKSLIYHFNGTLDFNFEYNEEKFQEGKYIMSLLYKYYEEDLRTISKGFYEKVVDALVDRLKKECEAELLTITKPEYPQRTIGEKITCVILKNPYTARERKLNEQYSYEKRRIKRGYREKFESFIARSERYFDTGDYVSFVGLFQEYSINGDTPIPESFQAFVYQEKLSKYFKNSSILGYTFAEIIKSDYNKGALQYLCENFLLDIDFDFNSTWNNPYILRYKSKDNYTIREVSYENNSRIATDLKNKWGI